MRSKLLIIFGLSIFCFTSKGYTQTVLRAEATFYYQSILTPQHKFAYRVTYLLTPIPLTISASDFKSYRYQSCKTYNTGDAARWDNYCFKPVVDGWTFVAAVYPVYHVERQIVDVETGALTVTQLPDVIMTVAPASAVYPMKELPEVTFFDGYISIGEPSMVDVSTYLPAKSGWLNAPKAIVFLLRSTVKTRFVKDARGLETPFMLEGQPLEITTLDASSKLAPNRKVDSQHLRWEVLEVRP